jgi:hypothetical protein
MPRKRPSSPQSRNARYVPPHIHSVDDLPIGNGPGQIPLATDAVPTVLKRRIQLAELPAALTYTALFASQIPEGQVVDKAFLYVNDAPAGGGVASCTADVAPSAPGGASYIETAELVGFASPAYYTKYSGAAADFELTVGDVHDADRDVGFEITADVNLDTLTNFDVTAYVILSPVVLTAP